MALKFKLADGAFMYCKSASITEDGSLIITQESTVVGNETGKADVITNLGHVTAKVTIERDAE